MGKVILLTLLIVAFSVLLLGIKVFFVRGGRFPNSHIGHNPHMKKRGITCALSTDRAEREKQSLYPDNSRDNNVEINQN